MPEELEPSTLVLHIIPKAETCSDVSFRFVLHTVKPLLQKLSNGEMLGRSELFM